MMNCNSCGGSLTSSEQTCKYCGAPNPCTESRSTPAAKKSVNWFMFVLLLIFFWPAAIVYLIIRIK